MPTTTPAQKATAHDVEDGVVYGVAYDLPLVVDGRHRGHRTVVKDLPGEEFARAAVAHRIPWKVDGVRATGHRVVTRPILSDTVLAYAVPGASQAPRASGEEYRRGYADGRREGFLDALKIVDSVLDTVQAERGESPTGGGRILVAAAEAMAK